MTKPLSAEGLPVGRILPNAEVIKARELVEARFAKGSSPSVAAIDGTLHERRRDRLPTPAAGSVGHESTLVTFEVAQQVTDVPLHRPVAMALN